MKLTIVLAVVTLATSAWPCSKPDNLTLISLFNQATWTVRTGSASSAEGPLSSSSRMAKVMIAMSAISREEEFQCLTWDVELFLPPSIRVRSDGDGNPGATTYTGLASTASAEFDLELPALRQNEVRDWQAWLRVKVRFPSDPADVFLSYGAGDTFAYPVTVHVAN